MSSSCRILVALALGACGQSSPLSQIEQYLQVEIEANPGNLAGRPPFTLSIETWNHLAVLGDAVDAGEITATLDDRSLVIDPSGTGYFQNRDYYRVRFGLPETRSATIHPPGISTITITDGETSWSGEIADLFTNDLAAQGPITPGQNELVWPSAVAPSPYSNIDWACVEVGVQASACGGGLVFEADGVESSSIAISQQFITANIDDAPGTPVVITGARAADRQSSGGPVFLAQIFDRLETTIGP